MNVCWILPNFLHLYGQMIYFFFFSFKPDDVITLTYFKMLTSPSYPG